MHHCERNLISYSHTSLSSTSRKVSLTIHKAEKWFVESENSPLHIVYSYVIVMLSNHVSKVEYDHHSRPHQFVVSSL